jgi:hypothetical protein
MSTSVASAADALVAARANFGAAQALPARLGLVDALLGLAGAQLSSGDPAAAELVLGDIREHLEHGVRTDPDWQLRASAASRLSIAIAQLLGRHDEAVAQLDTNLRSVSGTGPEADAARLSLLTARLQSHLALGQATRAGETLAAARQVVARMTRTIPARPASVLAATLLLQQASVAMLRNAPAEAEAAFAEALALVDRLGGSDLGELRRRIVRSWTSALKAQGRTAEATALVGRTLLATPAGGAPPGPFAP